jgi:amino acid adenylation domain-containing protein
VSSAVPFRSQRAADNGFAPGEGFRPFDLADAESTVALRFRESALRHAGRIALVDGDRRVTYRDLLDRAEKIGGVLRARFPGGGLIAIMMPYGLELVEALLGVLLGGFAYLPVDDRAPDAEIGRLIAASRPALLIAYPMDGARAAAFAAGVPVNDLDSILFSSAPEPGHDPVDAAQRAGSLTAVYATSGSSGAPKLVGLSNRAVLFDIGRQTNDLFLSPQDRFDQLFSFAFSASLAPLFGSLLNGGELHLFEARGRLHQLREWLAASQITVSTMSASMLRACCEADSPSGSLSHLRLISAGGEELLERDVERFRTSFPPSTVLQNAMAATETRTYAQYFVPRTGRVESPVPIGWPVHAKDILLLDESGQPVTDGEMGEVVVRSRYLSSGYLNDLQLTAERFEQAHTNEGEFLYRTSDLARQRADGCLLFAGRADSMVKLGGYRIELEAVAAAVRRFPGIRNAAAILREDVGGSPRIVAYYIPEAEASGLRQFLVAELPEYMVPAELVPLAELPLLPNGKLDRKSLPAPVRGLPESASAGMLPACERIEAELAAIWRDLLGHPVGVHEDFKNSGGDSLLALVLVERIERTFGVRINLAALLKAPTIEDLANVIRGPRSVTMPRLAEVQPNGSRYPIFCVHAELRFRSLAWNLGFDQPLLGLQLGEAGRLTTVAAMAAYHIETIRERQPHGPYHIMGFCAAGLVAYEVARQLLVSGDEVRLLALIDTYGPRKSRRQNWKEHCERFLQADGSRWNLVAARMSALRRIAERKLWHLLYRHGLPFEGRMREWIRRSSPEEFLPVIAAARRYDPPIYPGRLTLFRGPVGQLEPGETAEYGWAGMALGGLEIVEVPASHLEMPEDPIVAAELRRRVSGSPISLAH